MKNPKNNKTQNPELPEELITTEILPKLPAKSLIRFKCVSKNWQCIISSAHFAQAQLQAQMGPHSSSSRCVLSKESYFSILDYGKCDDIVDFDGPYDQYVNMCEFDDDFDFIISGGVPFIIGTCNGLVCFCWTDEDEEFSDDTFYVYNPCTGNYVEIEDDSESQGDNLIFGFGYVSSLDDYKIMLIGLKSRRPWYNVCVYSLRSEKWSMKRGCGVNELAFASDHADGTGGVLVNETLHWDMIVRLDDGSGKDCIGGFDLVEEEFSTMSLPVTKLGDKRGCHSGFRLCVLDECLCAWGRFVDGGVEMWMMKEYGVSDSWTKLFNLNLRKEVGEPCADFFGFSNAGKVLIRTDNEKLLFADLSYDPPKFVCLAQVDEAVNYVASLIEPSDIGAQSKRAEDDAKTDHLGFICCCVSGVAL